MHSKPLNSYLTWGSLFPHCLREIWLTRNDNLFNNKCNPINSDNAIDNASEYTLLAKSIKSPTNTHHIISLKWNPPHQTVTKLNIDCSAKGNLGPRGLGGVFRDRNDGWILGFYQHLPPQTQ